MNSKKLLSMLLFSFGVVSFTYGAEKAASVRAEGEAKSFEVQFNVNDTNNSLCVFTDYAVNKSIAPTPENISENPELEDSGRHSPVYGDVEAYDSGLIYFAIDANGYICYASYGTGGGYGSPCDGYYHNFRKTDGTIMNEKNDRGEMPIWSLHAEYNDWPNKTGDGRSAWTLYDFLIPEGGFVIKGQCLQSTFRSFYGALFDGATPFESDRNNLFESTLADGSLDNWYVYLDANRQLCVRERTSAEKQNAFGEQSVETPSKGFTTTAKDEVVVYKNVADIEQLGSKAKVTDFKALIVKKYGLEVWLQDEKGKTIRAYGGVLKEYAAGATVAVSGYKVNLDGEAVLSVTRVSEDLTGKYGAVEYNAGKVGSSELICKENEFAWIQVDEAEVLIASKGYSLLKVGDKEVYVKGAAITEDIKAGTKVLFNGFLEYEGENAVVSNAAVTPYHNIIVDHGLKGVKTTTELKGNKVVVTPSLETVYQFVKWQIGKVVNGEIVYEDYSTNRQIEVVVGAGDTYLKAISEVDPTNIYVGSVDVLANSGDTKMTVWTEAGTKLHNSTGWAGAITTNWRFIIVCDDEGKVIYAVDNPANGYGGPSGTGYYTAPEYSSNYQANPAIKILDGFGPWSQEDPTASRQFEIVVPEGGFAITAHSEYKNPLAKLISGNRVSEAGKTICARHAEWANVRLVYDSNEQKVSAFETEGDPTALANCYINAVNDKLPTIYNDKATKIEIPEGGDAYTLGIDANGKIIYGSYGLPMGFGGPADGFYHDGSYNLVAGQQCGIFDVYSTFAGWPATVDGRNAWEEYAIKVPTGGYIITGTRTQMLPIINKITGGNYTELPYWSNSIMEGLAKGSLNHLAIDVNEMTKIAAINVVGPELNYSGTKSGSFAYDAESKSFHGTVTLGLWNNIIFTYKLGGETKVLTYTNTTMNGFTASDCLDADWTYKLYHELDGGVDSALSGKFLCCMSGGCTYDVTYVPGTNTLTVRDANANVLKVAVNGGEEQVVAFVDGGLATGSFVVPAVWNYAQVFYYDADHKKTTIDGADCQGYFCSNGGADWTDRLYFEDPDHTKLYRCCDGAHTYYVQYTVETGKLYFSEDGNFPRLGKSISAASFGEGAGTGSAGSYSKYAGTYNYVDATVTLKDVMCNTNYDDKVVQVKKNTGTITVAGLSASTITVVLEGTFDLENAGCLTVKVGGTELKYTGSQENTGKKSKSYDVYKLTYVYTVGTATGDIEFTGSSKGACYVLSIDLA